MNRRSTLQLTLLNWRWWVVLPLLLAMLVIALPLDALRLIYETIKKSFHRILESVNAWVLRK